MTTALFSHPHCLEHKVLPANLEQPARLLAVLEALAGPEFSELDHRSAPPASWADIRRGHSQTYLDFVVEMIPANDKYWALDDFTIISAASNEAARQAVGLSLAAVDAVMTDTCRNAFCALRPPGHHASANKSGGLCIYNNAVLAGLHARHEYGIHRVALVDFDIHHGDGSQAFAQNDPDMLFISTHQSDIFPQSGAAGDCGKFGNLINLPLPAGADGAFLRERLTDKAWPRLKTFAPELILVSAGFDGHKADTLADSRFVEDDYRWLGQELTSLADQLCQGRLVAVLEGGYNPTSLAASAAAFINAMMTPPA